mgnify:CR=1 FL=1
MFYNTPKTWGTLMRTGALLLALIATTPTLAENSTWQPSASERLVKLPGNYIKKAIDQDFQGSALATALGDIGSRISNKTQTLEDLRSATEQAEGEAHDELQQQLLAEKQEYIKLMGERQGLSRKQINTKVRLYEALLRKLENRGKGTNQSNQKLAQNQEVAKQRFATSVATVDMKLFNSSTASQSKYGKEYSKNMAAIESLVSTINSHPMNAQPEFEGQPLSKQEYLRQLIAEGTSSLAVLNQEETILGYMAKLVALDAMALSEGLIDNMIALNVDDQDLFSPTSAIKFFTPRN